MGDGESEGVEVGVGVGKAEGLEVAVGLGVDVADGLGDGVEHVEAKDAALAAAALALA